MPTRTFLNLPKEKRIRILRAAKKEFSRVPLEKAVIANIVKEAQIPRGSFYQYFENVEDLFIYLIHYMYGIDRKKFQRYLRETDNDVYEALKMKFSDTTTNLQTKKTGNSGSTSSPLFSMTKPARTCSRKSLNRMWNLI